MSAAEPPPREPRRAPAGLIDAGLWLAIVSLYFAPVLASGRVLAFGDALNQDLPLRVLAFGQLAQGHFPFWNPWVFAGQPLLAGIQVGVFFPGNWPFLLLAPAAAMNTAAIGAVFIAGLGMVGFGRALGLGRPAALAGAAVFGLGGFMVMHLENLPIAQGAALAPALLWAVARLADTGQRRYAAAGAALLALQVLAGHPQTVVFAGLALAAYALFRAWAPGAGRARFLARAAVIPLAGAGLAALQLWPTLDFIPETQRAAIGWEQLVARSLPPRQLATLWLPFLMGGIPSALFPLPYWGAPHLTELVGYGGLAALVAAALALTRGPLAGEARFWAGVAAVALVLALGRFTPLYALIAQLPGLGALPAPGRHLLAFDLALATLAMLGVQRLSAGSQAASGRATLLAWLLGAGPALAGALVLAVAGGALAARIQPWLPAGTDLAAGWQPTAPAVWLPALLALLVGGLLVAWRRGRPVAAWLVALLLLDLALFGWHAGWRQRAIDAARLPWPPPLALAGHARALAIYPDAVYPYDQPAVIQALRLPNWGALGGVRHVGGYDAFVYARYAALLGGLHSGGAIADPADVFHPRHHMLDLLATRQVLLDERLAREPAWRARLAAPRWRRVGAEPGVVRFENARALPRAWVARRTIQADAAAIAERVRGERPFDPTREALFEGPPPSADGRGGTARVVAEADNRLTVEATGTGPVVVSVNWDPGWRAIGSGRYLPVHRVNGCLLAVEADGSPRFELLYTPRRWGTGLAISLASALLLLGWLARGRWLASLAGGAVGRRQDRRPGPATPPGAAV